jgi:hypothetical protein
MGWRYRKSFRLFPGVRINVSSRGVSTTIGVRGASVNFSNRGTYLNTGIPGTGISYRQRIDVPVKTVPSQVPVITPAIEPALPEINYYTLTDLHLPGAIKSAAVDTLTSAGLQDLRALLAAAVSEAKAIKGALAQTNTQLATLQQQELTLRKSFLGKFLNKKKILTTQAEIEDATARRKELEEQQSLCTVPLDSELESAFAQAYKALASAFQELAICKAIWDKTSAVASDPRVTRSAATATVTRQRVQFTYGGTDLVPSDITPCHLENANGSDIYLYPGFILIYENASSFALIDWRDFNLEVNRTRFIEDEAVPSDTITVDETWRYINKNGSPDRRFSDNRIIPIVEYADAYITTPSGMNEAYCFSNPEKAENFCVAVTAYRNLFSTQVNN